MGASKIVFVSIALAAASGTTAAQPSRTPLDPVAEPRSESTALRLSLGGTLASAAVVGIGLNQEEGGVVMLGGIGLLLTPSFGHWYAGDRWTGGLAMRAVGAGVTFVGATFLMCVTEEGSGSCRSEKDYAIFFGGLATLVGGAVWDTATAPGAAREHNARRARDVTLLPTVGSGRAGLALTGHF